MSARAFKYAYLAVAVAAVAVALFWAIGTRQQTTRVIVAPADQSVPCGGWRPDTACSTAGGWR